MKHNQSLILTINGGSSSIKFAVYKCEPSPFPELLGQIAGIGSASVKLNFSKGSSGQKNTVPIQASNFEKASNYLIEWLKENIDFSLLEAIGHRIVHGMKHTKPELISDAFLAELRNIITYDPEHLPAEIDLIERFASRYPTLSQFACFDTSFHTSMPLVAKQLAIPRRYVEQGIQRYGFHGLSYTYLLEELEKIAGTELAKGKIIIAHLGSGASLAAIKDGKSVDTTMGFTPASGLPMSTRSGDLDPGVASYLIKTEQLTPQAFNQLINHQSGLLGLSETSGDMQELLRIQAVDGRAAEAINFFCYQSKKWIGAYTAALGGLDVLIFSGGIGEHAAEVRQKICDDLEFLGIEVEPVKNKLNECVISSAKSKVIVYVIKTNEELMIARQVLGLLKPGN